MLKLPTMINYATKMNKDFSFLVKEELGKYKVYDFLAEPSVSVERKLPTDTSKSKEDLDLFIELLTTLNFKVKRIDDVTIEYVDPECEEYEDVDLPLYNKTGRYKTFSYMGTSYMLKNIPTKKTIDAAMKYREKVRKTVKQEVEKINVEIGLQDSFDNVSFVYETKCDVSEILDSSKYLVIHLRIPYTTDYSYKTLIIDKEAAKTRAKNGSLTLLVPGAIVGMVIGKGGKNCKIISNELGIKNVSVIAG